EILEKLDAPEELIQEVCSIIKNLEKPNGYESQNLNLVHDANLLASLQEKSKKTQLDENFLSEVIGRDFITDAGRGLAQELLLKSSSGLEAASN
ncbi:MAG: phosphohydrolase, partial [Deltaproteobacteria bacterium]|nr:phosphohydrolase [Deltaproteobacteria bacterium]